MAQEITSLVLAVDSSPVKAAAGELDKLATAGKKAESASSRLEKAFADMLTETRGIGSSVQELVRLAAAANTTAAAAAKIAPQMQAVETASEGAAAAVNETSRSLSRIGATGPAEISKTTVALKQMTQQADTAAITMARSAKAFDAFGGLGVSRAATSTAAAFTKVTTASTQMAATNKLSAQQMQQLSYQLNDFFVQVSSGGSPLTALIQQGSQLSGSFGGIGNSIRAVMSVLTPFRVAVGASVGAVVALASGIYKGSEQSLAFERSLQLTANAAGLTEGKFNSLGRSLAESTKTGVGSTRELLQSLVSTGRFSGEALTKTAEAALLFQKATGQTSEEVLQRFVAMRNGVTKWAEETNKQYHFLTASQLEYIRRLDEQGNSEKAVAVTMAALAERVRGAAQNLGILERTWQSVARAASAGWDAILGIGRQATPEDGVAALERRIANARKQREDNAKFGAVLGDSNSPVSDAQISGMEESLRILRKQRDAQAGIAAAQQKSAALQQATIEVDKLKLQYLDKQKQKTLELADANAKFDKIGAAKNDPERLKVISEIEKRFKESAGSKGAGSGIGSIKMDVTRDVSDIQSEFLRLTSTYRSAESILEATRQAGLIDEKSYYEEKLGLIKLNSDAEVNALAEKNARLKESDKELADLQQKNKNKGGQSGDSNDVAIQNKRIDNQRVIAENEARISVIQEEAAAKGFVLSTQQAAALANLTRSYKEARISAEDFLASIAKQGQRDVDAVGQSDRQRNAAAGRAQIEERYEQQRRELENNKKILEFELKFTEEARAQYDQRLAIINEFQTKAVASWEKTYADIAAEESNWANGSRRAIQNYLDQTDMVADQVEGAFTRGFKGMEDAIVGFVTTGKLNFKTLATSIIADLVRIQAQAAISGIFKMILGIGGSGSVGNAGFGDYKGYYDGLAGAPGRAIGGPVSAGSLYQVNERGPELLNAGGKQYLMMGSQGGSVTPNAGGPATVNNIHVEAGVQRNEVVSMIQLAFNASRSETDAKLRKAGVVR